MEKYLDVLEKCDLFDGIAQEHIQGMLFCLQAKVLTAVKNQTVFAEGDIARYVGIVLSGAVMMVKEDFN